MAAGDTRNYIGETDLTLMYPVVDINGLNRVSRAVIRNAAAAIAGMAQRQQEDADEMAPAVAISMMGVTTTVAMAVSEQLRAAGFETLSFHMTGSGGRTMESLIRSGSSLGWPISRHRSLLTNSSAGSVQRGPSESPQQVWRGSPKSLAWRTRHGQVRRSRNGSGAVPRPSPARAQPTDHTLEDRRSRVAELGRRLAERLNGATGPTLVIVPERGFSQIAVAGGPFQDPVADKALIDALTSGLNSSIEVRRLDADINDPAVATITVDFLTRMEDAKL